MGKEMEHLGKRLAELRRARGMSQSDLAALLNVSQTAVSAWETGRNEPDIGTLNRLASLLGVDLNALVGSSRSEKEAPVWPAGLTVMIPVFSNAEGYLAGKPDAWEEVPVSVLGNGAHLCFRVSDDSMKLARLEAGDLAIVRRTDKPTEGAVCLLLIDDSRLVVRRLWRSNGAYLLGPAHPDLPPEVLPASRVKVLGVVVRATHEVR